MADNIKAKLAVIYDAYLTTFRDEVRVARGNYLDIHTDATCRVCLLGALFVGNMLGPKALDVLNRHGVPSAAVETPCG